MGGRGWDAISNGLVRGGLPAEAWRRGGRAPCRYPEAVSQAEETASCLIPLRPVWLEQSVQRQAVGDEDREVTGADPVGWAAAKTLAVSPGEMQPQES